MEENHTPRSDTREPEKSTICHGIVVVNTYPTGPALQASCLCGWLSPVVQSRPEAAQAGITHVEQTLEASYTGQDEPALGAQHVAPVEPPRPTWHPLWCRITGCDGEEHLGHQTQWQPRSDDVLVSVQAYRWDDHDRDGTRHNGVPKVAINLENIAMQNNDGSAIKAEVHLDAVELRLLIRFLERELDRIVHDGALGDMPVSPDDEAGR